MCPAAWRPDQLRRCRVLADPVKDGGREIKQDGAPRRFHFSPPFNLSLPLTLPTQGNILARPYCRSTWRRASFNFSYLIDLWIQPSICRGKMPFKKIQERIRNRNTMKVQRTDVQHLFALHQQLFFYSLYAVTFIIYCVQRIGKKVILKNKIHLNI